MAERLQPSLGWIGAAQSKVILPTARTMYTAVACVLLALAVLGMLVAAYFQFASVQFAKQVPVPAAYVERPAALTFEAIDRRLSPPANVRFAPVPSIEQPIDGSTVLGRFAADTPNALADAPDDFDIVGGKDTALFQRTTYSYDRTGLQAAPELVALINAALPNLRTQQSKVFELRVVARDSAGRLSAPSNITFALNYGPPPAAAVAEAPSAPLDDLETLAREIALVVDPGRTPAYFDAYRRALETPRRCGARNDETFTTGYRAAFVHARANLSSANINLFYLGVCEAWNEAVQRQAAERAKAEAARAEALLHNAQEQASAAAKAFAARSLRNITLMLVGGAVSAFLTIALLLAFLALESHSKAMRQAIEILADRAGDARGRA